MREIERATLTKIQLNDIDKCDMTIDSIMNKTTQNHQDQMVRQQKLTVLTLDQIKFIKMERPELEKTKLYLDLLREKQINITFFIYQVKTEQQQNQLSGNLYKLMQTQQSPTEPYATIEWMKLVTKEKQLNTMNPLKAKQLQRDSL